MLARGFVPPLRGWFFFLKRNPRALPCHLTDEGLSVETP